MGTALLNRLRGTLDRSGFWDEFQTDWACFDAELMPWSAKARALIEEQYAPVGSAAMAGLGLASDILEQAASRGVEVAGMCDRFAERREAATRYDAAWRRYAWEVASVDDLRLAPFHLMATEGVVHEGKDHTWHMRTIAEICTTDPGVLFATQWREVDLANEGAVADACAWWEDLTGRGGEGAVIKPQTFLSKGPKGIIQPALKCRGREYLRIIYGPEYTLPHHLERLRTRAWAPSATSRSRSSRWAWKPYTALSIANRCAVCTNASSPCWPWKASRLIRGCEICD